MPPRSVTFAAFQFFELWSQGSPLGAAEAASGLEPALLWKRSLQGVFHTWGTEDPEAMMAWASTQEKRVAQMALRSFYEGNGLRDPEGVLNLMGRYPEISDWWTTVELASSLATTGKAGWARVTSLPDGPKKRQIAMRFGSSMARTDPEGLWELAERLSPEDRRYLLRLGVSNVARVAPAEVVSLAATEWLGAHYQLRSAIEIWAETTPDAALNWSATNLSGRERTDALGAALGAWMKTDPGSAVGALQGLPLGLRARLLPGAARSWGGAEPNRALEWANSLGNLDRVGAIDAVIQGWAAEDPVAAAEALATVPTEGLGRAHEDVARRLAEKDPKAAVEWAAGLAGDSDRSRSITSAVRSWGGRDAEAASGYVANLNPGRFRDRAAEGLVDSIRQLDPGSAAEWAISIEDSGLQMATLRRVVSGWREQDPEAAKRYVDTLPSGELRTELGRVGGSHPTPR